ncbi:hypothetical protein [Streptomyces sp. NPDC029041]|uniref:hypothetical protein n=1 Tax=Streptomyces sp. NPDC029041 TaxID=3155727 RepID=UPI0033DC80D1
MPPDELVHVSASPMYDLRSAAVPGIENKVHLDRGSEYDEHRLGYERTADIAGLPVDVKVRAERIEQGSVVVVAALLGTAAPKASYGFRARGCP